MTRRTKRHREKVVDYSASNDTGIRLVVRLLRYEAPPQARHRQYAPVPGHAAKLTVQTRGQLDMLWTRIDATISGYAREIQET